MIKLQSFHPNRSLLSHYSGAQNVGIESTISYSSSIHPEYKIQRIQSYASLKRINERYRTIMLFLSIVIVLLICAFTFTYIKLMDVRDTYIMHNYTYHYEGAKTIAPPLTWSVYQKEKEGE